MANCIYCNSDANTLEHVIPAAFGEFRGAPALKDRLCKDCNNQRLGLLDQQVARCGPEGFMRAFYGVRGRSSHTPVNPFVRGSAGGGRLVFATFDREVGVEANLEILDGVVRQMCELVLVETAGKAHHFPLTEATTADQLRAAIKRRAIPEPYEARLSCYPHERIWIKKLLQEHSPEVTFSQPKLMSQVIETPEVHFQNGERYFRGLAKIGLHYFLTQFPVYSGHEQVFSTNPIVYLRGYKRADPARERIRPLQASPVASGNAEYRCASCLRMAGTCPFGRDASRCVLGTHSNVSHRA